MPVTRPFSKPLEMLSVKYDKQSLWNDFCGNQIEICKGFYYLTKTPYCMFLSCHVRV